MPTRQDVRDFLASFKLAIDYRRCDFVPRQRTEQDLIDLNLTRKLALEIICSLTPENYSAGPSPDDTDATKEVWIFGYDHERDEVYIKLRLVPQPRNQLPRGAVWSFHRAEHPMRYPLQGGA